MSVQNSGYSPNILIYLEIGENHISLSDLLYNSARISESLEVPPRTEAWLVISIDGHEERELVMLDNGINQNDSLLHFPTPIKNGSTADTSHFS